MAAASQPIPSFTPYADVNEALAELLTQVQRALGAHLIALYLSGSLALGDFDPNTSDIDLVAVTEGLLTSSQQESLCKLHEYFEAGASPWAGKVEVVYIERAALRRPLAEATPYPQVEKEGGFFVAPLEDGWLTQTSIVREHGVALFGPDPKTLIVPVDIDAMRRSLAHIPEKWLQQARHDPSWIEWLRERANQAFVTLTLCRLLYTLETGAVASKPGAARWAQRTLPPRWAALIANAPSGQRDHGLITDEEVTETVALVEYTVAAFRPFHPCSR